jgi:uncharacterized protein YaaN involved in tellurite resistance
VIDDHKLLLTDIDLELEEILSEEYGAVAQIEKEYVKLQKRIESTALAIEKEVDKYEPDLSVLELLRGEYFELLYQRLELDKQYAIAQETIATIELEQIELEESKEE